MLMSVAAIPVGLAGAMFLVALILIR